MLDLKRVRPRTGSPPSSFHPTPEPKTLSTIAMPFSIRSGSARMRFHQSAYSSHENGCFSTNDSRWREGRIIFVWFNCNLVSVFRAYFRHPPTGSPFPRVHDPQLISIRSINYIFIYTSTLLTSSRCNRACS